MTVRNILFIMCDQLRADYLSCYGHPWLQTRAIDGLAARGSMFTRAYVQAPVCGPARMSFYTGRYVQSHGASWNAYPLPIGERTLGDYLRPAGIRTAVVGKTHVKPDEEAMARLGISPAAGAGMLAGQGGFEPYVREDGIYPPGASVLHSPYAQWLREQGYESANPWHDYANSALGAAGELLSGWQMRNARRPARVKEEHSETAYATAMAMAFMNEQGTQPWCLHLSYIKPHWPYIAPAPYHAMFDASHVLPAVRSLAERENPHPVFGAFMQHDESVSLSREVVRRTVIPTYMGLIRQIDDHLGRLFTFMQERGLMDDTLIVLTSDHGDYLGDHWLGEKDLFHEQSVRIPLIIAHPDYQQPTVSHDLVESIDLLPTLLDAVAVAVPDHVVEGRSLLPCVVGNAAPARDAVFSEIDYSAYPAAAALGIRPDQARGVMIRTDRWKYVHWDGFRPQIFDMQVDPQELEDLGDRADMAPLVAEMQERLFLWLRNRKSRVTAPDVLVTARTNARKKVAFGSW